MKKEFWERQRRFSIRKLTVGVVSALLSISPVLSSVSQVIVYADTVGEPQKAAYILNGTVQLGNLVNQVTNPTPAYDTVRGQLTALETLINEYQREKSDEQYYNSSTFAPYEAAALTAKNQYSQFKSVFDAMERLRDSGKVQQYASEAVTIRDTQKNSQGTWDWSLDGDTGEVGPTTEERTRAYDRIFAMFTEVQPIIQAYTDAFSGSRLQQLIRDVTTAKNKLQANTAKQVKDQGLFPVPLSTAIKVSNLTGVLTEDEKETIRNALESLDVFMDGWALTSDIVFNNDGTLTVVFVDDASQMTVRLSDLNIVQNADRPQEEKTYTVSYRFEGEIPAGKQAPSAVTNLRSGAQIPIPAGDSAESREKTYSLEWIKPSSPIIQGQNVEVVGRWTATPKPTYTVRYSYVGAVPSGEVAPEAVSQRYTGDSIAIPENRTVKLQEGTYRLTWDRPSSLTVAHQDVEVVGRWSFEAVPAKTYTVTATYKTLAGVELSPATSQTIEDGKNYTTTAPTELTHKGIVYALTGQPANASSRVSGDNVTVAYLYEPKLFNVLYRFETSSNQPLPESVNSFLPASSSAKSGETVSAPSATFSPQSGTVSGVEGQWQFTSWEIPSQVITNQDITFKGIWEFLPTKTYTVSYRFEGEIPAGKQVPSAVTNLRSGAQIPIPTGDSAESREKTYSLEWIKPSSPIIQGQNVEVVGTWTATSKPTYTVRYSYVGAVPSGEVAPEAVSQRYTGDSIAIPENRTVKLQEGTYRLTWDRPSSLTVAHQDVEVVGRWSFEAVPAKTYEVTYRFISSDNSLLPQEIIDLLPQTQIGLEIGSVVRPPSSLPSRDFSDGTWTFQGWTPSEQTVTNANLTFVGEWKWMKKDTSSSQPLPTEGEKEKESTKQNEESNWHKASPVRSSQRIELASNGSSVSIETNQPTLLPVTQKDAFEQSKPVAPKSTAIQAGNKGTMLPKTNEVDSSFLAILGISSLWASTHLLQRKSKHEDDVN